MNRNVSLPFANSQRRKEFLNSRYRSTGVLLIAAVLLGGSFLLTPRTRACGPFFTDAIFVFSKHPDFPLDNYASGKIGIVNQSWARSYLVAAYRTLSGNPLSEREARAMKSLWDERLNSSGDAYDESSIKKWNEARSKVPGAPKAGEIQAYRNREKPREYESFLNCQSDAFATAEATLAERISKFGADSQPVRDWLAAQDTVFANCSEGRHIPDAASSSDPLVRADRAYQIAAANFYATNFDEAKQQFDAIARDKESPWRVTAAYVAARSMLRKASFAEKEEEGQPFLADAESRLNAILKDGSMKASHHAAARLLNLVRVRLHPEDKLHELGRSILKKDADEEFRQSVWDYTILMDKYLKTEDDTAKPKIPPGITSDELTDWIATFEGDLENGEAHAIERWEKTKSVVWLIAAMANAEGRQPKLNEMLVAAANVSPSSPAFSSVAFHSVRLLKEANRQTEARALLDRILANRNALPASALNQFLAERMLVAQNLEEFLQTAQRVPAGFSDDNDGREIPDDPKDAAEIAKGSKYFFDADAANAFNKAMPVALINDAAQSRTLAANLRRDTAQAAFMRAALLDDRETAMQAATLLQDVYPQIKEFLTGYQRATTPDERRFAAAFMSLKYPGLRPYVSTGVGRSTPVNEVDSYRDNYWCTEPPGSFGGSPAEGEGGEKPKPLPVPDFLKPSQTLSARQFAALQALGTAPNYLCRIAIDWANKNPSDPRAPEALHLAVRSTRYGCTDQETGRWSKAAFDLLHRKYPNTTWANNTKYWFKG